MYTISITQLINCVLDQVDNIKDLGIIFEKKLYLIRILVLLPLEPCTLGFIEKSTSELTDIFLIISIYKSLVLPQYRISSDGSDNYIEG